MASNKEALILLVDIGVSMSDAPTGFDSPLQIASDILQMIIQRKMFQESKDELALILYGTDESRNDLADESNYQYISIQFPLGLPNWHMFEEIQKIQPGHQQADMIDALVVAADHLRRETEGKRGFVAKRILLFTNAASPFNDENLQVIMDSLRRNDIIVDAIGPYWGENIDDEHNHGNDEDHSPEQQTASARPTTDAHQQAPRKPLTEQQQVNIRVVQKLVEQTEGTTFTFREALSILTVHQSKTVKPTATKYVMQLAELKIHISTYIQVKENKPGIFRLKKVYARDPKTEIKIDRSRYTKDEQDEEIEKEELTDGFRYGTTFVPIDKEMLEDMKYHSEKCFSVIGFSDAHRVRRSLYMGDTLYEVIAEPQYEEETYAFTALVQAMYDTDTVAIVRRCFSERSSPEIGFLQPYIAHDHICMYYIKLPFAEDIRDFPFEPLDSFKKNQPNDEQLKCFDDLITTMDLTHADVDGGEALRPETVFNPYIQRMFQSIARRAVTPEKPLSISNSLLDMNENLIQTTAERSKRALDTIQEKFIVHDTGRRQKLTTGDALFGEHDITSKKMRLEQQSLADEDEPVSNKQPVMKTIGTVNPVDDFNALIEQGHVSLDEILKQMTSVIREMINNSHGDTLFDKIIKCLQTLRDTCIRKLEPKIFNDLLVLMKNQTNASDGRKDFWQRLVQEKMSFITGEECIESNVITVEALKFLEDEVRFDEFSSKEQNDDEEDLFDLI